MPKSASGCRRRQELERDELDSGGQDKSDKALELYNFYVDALWR